MSRRHCPHVGNDRFGDEQEWCVVCLRDEVKDLKARLRSIRKHAFSPAVMDSRTRIQFEADLRVKNWRKP